MKKLALILCVAFFGSMVLSNVALATNSLNREVISLNQEKPKDKKSESSDTKKDGKSCCQKSDDKSSCKKDNADSKKDSKSGSSTENKSAEQKKAETEKK